MPSLTPHVLLAIILRRATTFTSAMRSRLRRSYITLAYPQIRIERDVVIQPGAQLRAYDGGSMLIGAGTLIGRGVTMVADGARLEIGPRGFVGQGSIIVAASGITIGADSLIAEGVTIRDQDHPIAARPRNREPVVALPIAIGDNVWIAAKASILKNVTIGDDCVIGAHAVVTRDTAPGSIAVGIPATVHRQIDEASSNRASPPRASAPEL